MRQLKILLFLILIFIPIFLLSNNFELNIVNKTILPFYSNNSIIFYDISNPASPTKISDFTIKNIRKIYTKNNLVFVISDKLYILDLKNPSSPTLISTLEFDDYISDIYIDNDFLFVACKNNGVFIFNIKSPEYPKLLSYWNAYVNKELWDIEVKDGYAYLALNNFDKNVAYFYLMDLSDLSNPYVIKTWHENNMTYKYLKIYNDKLIFNGDNSVDFLIYDIKNKIPIWEKRVLINKYIKIYFNDKPFEFSQQDLFFINDYIIEILNSYGIAIYNDLSPSNVRYIPINGNIINISAKDNYLYVSTDKNELKIINLENIHFVNLKKEYKENAKYSDMVIKEDFLFAISMKSDSLDVFDISNENMDKITSYKLNFISNPLNFEIEKNYAYIVGDYGLEIVDVSNPASLQTIGRFPHKRIFDIKVSENFAIVKDQDDNVFLLDLSSFLKPNFIDKIKLWYKKRKYPNNYALPEKRISLDIKYFSNLIKKEDYLYILGDKFLKVDVKKPSKPKIVEDVSNEEFKNLGTEKTLLLTEDFIILNDIKNFKQSTIKVHSTLGGGTYSAIIEGNYLYLPIIPYTILVFEIGDLDNPKLIAAFDEKLDYEYDLKIKNSYLFTSGNNGIKCYDISALSKKPEIITIKINNEKWLRKKNFVNYNLVFI